MSYSEGCCIRMDAEEIVSNLLASKSLSYFNRINLDHIQAYCKELSQAIPTYVFFESSPQDINRAANFHHEFCIWDRHNQTLHLLDDNTRPNRDKTNSIYRRDIAEIIGTVTDFFVETNISMKNQKGFADWILERK